MAFSTVDPRHVLCLLGRTGGFDALVQSIQSAIDAIAPDFEIDLAYSQDSPYDVMPRSFDVCRDRVFPGAWTDQDEQAVEEHGCVVYVLGPPMTPATAVDISAKALGLIAHALDHGAIAAKGESAGIAHGVDRWKQLGKEAEQSTDGHDLARICRLALAKRPLDDGAHFCSIGFHLVGLPDVYIPKTVADDAIRASEKIDAIGDAMARRGFADMLRDGDARLEPIEDYDEDDFRYNPYGGLFWTQAS